MASSGSEDISVSQFLNSARLLLLSAVLIILVGCEQNACKIHLMPDVKGNAFVYNYLTDLQSITFFSGCQVEGSFLWYLSWYQERVPRWRFLASFLTISTILLGAAIPVVSQLQDRLWRPALILSILGALIVVIQGVSESYKFQPGWHGFVQAKVHLELSHSEWQLRVINIARSPNIQDGDSLKMLNEATVAFVKEAKDIIEKETEGFYNHVELGARKPNQQNPADPPVVGQSKGSSVKGESVPSWAVR